MAVNFLDDITVDGDVGIGTASPTKELDVNGDVTFGTGNKFQTIVNALEGVGANGVYLRSAISSAANPSFSNSDDTNTGMFLPGSDVLGLSTAGSERLRITSAGNVGIGTSTPTEKLHVKTSGVEVAKYETTATADLAIELANSQGSMFFGLGGGEQFGVGTTSDLNGTGSLFIIEQGGNVGVGTTSPSQKLTVNGTIMSTGASNPQLILQDSTHSDITIKGDSGIFSVTNQSVGQNITMLYNGNVGIGTTSPSTKLDVNGTFEATSVRSTGGGDGGFVLRQWTHSSNYGSLATNGMQNQEYCMISDGTNTFIGAGTNGALRLRGPANDSSPQIAIDGSSVTVDNGASVGTGTIRAKYKSSDNSSGTTATFTVRNGNNSAALTLTIKDGIITSVSSDRRLKENITLIGTSDSGINIYTYEYKYKFSLAGVGLFQGVMSDEVPAEAVSVDEYGYDVVDYSAIDVEFKRLSN